jgi:hypothetical protein
MFSLLKVLATFASSVSLENVHPLQCGIFRLKHPSERRPGLPRESAWIFWPRFAWESLYKHCTVIGTTGRLLLVKMAITRDPNAMNYTDRALTPVRDDDDETFDLLTKTGGAQVAIAHVKRVAELTGAH